MLAGKLRSTCQCDHLESKRLVFECAVFMKIKDRHEALDFVVATHRGSIITHRGGGERELATGAGEGNENDTNGIYCQPSLYWETIPLVYGNIDHCKTRIILGSIKR